jgi:transcriptional regulator with XRE-family HTH domain
MSRTIADVSENRVGYSLRMPTPPKHVVVSRKQIGERLRELRRARGVSQVELAKALGTYQTSVSAIERGARGVTVQQLIKLAGALDASLDEMVGRSARPTNGALKDRRFLKRFQRIDRLSKRQKQTLLGTIDTFLKGAGVSD